MKGTDFPRSLKKQFGEFIKTFAHPSTIKIQRELTRSLQVCSQESHGYKE